MNNKYKYKQDKLKIKLQRQQYLTEEIEEILLDGLLLIDEKVFKLLQLFETWEALK